MLVLHMVWASVTTIHLIYVELGAQGLTMASGIPLQHMASQQQKGKADIYKWCLCNLLKLLHEVRSTRGTTCA